MEEIKGVNGQAEFDGQYLTIRRNGGVARRTIGKGEKRLHISQISAVQWKPAGALFGGFIQFTIPGGVEKRSSFGTQTRTAAQDENSIVFTKKQQPHFERLRAALDEAIARHHAPQTSTAAPSIADEIAKLAALRDQRVITDADFEQAKARLLGG
ncbi:hypothetical protein RVR_10584 [Actinacidiphila reveromycinica]|uniref:DUF4429 domain-containing protein n=1 Tax=Actinacidiphila reveromycinica TaxID=659352 RepID=A0A7U3VRB6_9ACTN|nr:DUF4429 domain-containing protein [Streptomyces sp. SN-593]BBB00585.1 hypothetical protein RVR_7718 [Streptomyces sp. SN-593]BBB00638.1 hypothetical protein RVR_10584 [Streptomyces sp. SN-593]